MILNMPRLQAVETIPLQVSDPRHFASPVNSASSGKQIVELSKKISGDAGTSFQDAMLRALDGVSAEQQKAGSMIEAAITDPDSVDVHDVTIAQAKASLSLNITRTVLSRLVQGWRDLVNTR